MVLKGREDHSHYVIEGCHLACLSAVLTMARQKGFNGSLQTLRIRMKNGPHTWAYLAAPVDSGGAQNGAKKRWTNARAEMDELIAGIDARKKAIAESQK